jgi:shikimate dehydrogenase
VSKSLGAKVIYKVSRSSKENFITYDELYNISDTIDVIINTTPVGMHPNIFESAVEIERFKNLSGVVDAVYNPLRSKLVLDALKRNIKAVGGLYMLVAQAAFAVEFFIDTKIEKDRIESVFNALFKQKENIVLIGMPSSGKSTVGNILAEKLKREFFDSDLLVAENENMTIPDIFESKGEAYFRNAETEAIFTLSKNNSSVIATGGGAVLNKKNIELLKENGKLFFLDRPLEMLITTSDRPLSSNKSDLEKRYNERYNLYKVSADVVIDASGTVEDVINQIMKVTE